MPEPRAAVRRMRPYAPPTGGRSDKVRLDFNENTVGCSPGLAAYLRAAVEPGTLATYPTYDEARGKLAAFFQVEETELVLTNGTDEAIQLVVNAYVDPGDEVVIPTPTFAMYRFYAEVAAANIVELPYPPDLRLTATRVLASLTGRTKAIFLSNPNNPTGTAMPIGEIETILCAAPQASVLVDEAYFEFFGHTALPLIRRHGNLFVSRTFSKAHGLAAMRVGCALTRAANAEVLRKCQSPYSVNTLAAMAAAYAAENREAVSRYVRDALAGRRLIEEGLARLGLRFTPSQANFVLFDAADRADAILAGCREAGVLIRDRRGDLPRALRVTAGTPEQARRFLAVVEACR